MTETSSKQVVALTRRIDRWLLAAGVHNAKRRSGMAVDLADLFAAATAARRALLRLLNLDPAKVAGAERGLALATEIEAWLFTELKDHSRSLERDWPMIVRKLAEASEPLTRGRREERRTK
jgi:hypothetical protein